MNERDFIDLLRPLAGPAGLKLNDDAACLTPPSGQDLVISKDTFVEGVHFPAGRIGGGFSERLLRTALSDLAAKAARPVGYFLSVAWPRGRDARWPGGFVRGLSDVQEAYDCPLLGGDTTSHDGPLVTSATVLGYVPSGQMIMRSGARLGDDIYYTGTLGRAENGLKLFMGEVLDLPPAEALACEEAYLRPEPRFVFRKALRNYASACADISDGLLSEASHIAAASECRLDLDPVENVKFGDDYELIFTAPERHRAAIEADADALNIPVTRCGRVCAGEGITVAGEPVQPSGYRHSF